jgi:hypothetical protein
MIRPLLIEFALFLAPFAAYAAYVWFAKGEMLEQEHWPLRVVAILAGVALVLVVGCFLAIVHFSGAPIGSTYVPAHLEDGKLIPGRVVP